MSLQFSIKTSSRQRNISIPVESCFLPLESLLIYFLIDA